MTWMLTEAGTRTKVEMTYVVGGYMRGGVQQAFEIVDQVLGGQVQRLKRYVDRARSGLRAPYNIPMRIEMKRRSFGLAAAAVAVLTLAVAGVAQQRERAEIPDRYKWNLAEIYPTTDAWRAAKDKVESELPKIGAFRGKLGSSASVLADALETLYALDKELSRASVYVSMLADQDTRASEPHGMREQMVQLAAGFGSQASYVEPEILTLPKATLDAFIASEPRLKVFRFYLEDIVRRGAHTLSQP